MHQGKWVYLYHALDEEGHNIDFKLSRNRDAEAARAFFVQALESRGLPEKVVVAKRYLAACLKISPQHTLALKCLERCRQPIRQCLSENIFDDLLLSNLPKHSLNKGVSSEKGRHKNWGLFAAKHMTCTVFRFFDDRSLKSIGCASKGCHDVQREVERETASELRA